MENHDFSAFSGSYAQSLTLCTASDAERAAASIFLAPYANYPLLTRADEHRLLDKALRGNDEAADILVGSNMPRIYGRALGMAHAYPYLSADVLAEAGARAFRRAISESDGLLRKKGLLIDLLSTDIQMAMAAASLNMLGEGSNCNLTV